MMNVFLSVCFLLCRLTIFDVDCQLWSANEPILVHRPKPIQDVSLIPSEAGKQLRKRVEKPTADPAEMGFFCLIYEYMESTMPRSTLSLLRRCVCVLFVLCFFFVSFNAA